MSKYFDNKPLFMEPNVSQYGSHMVMTGVNKECKTKFVNIDTKFCDDYVNNRTDSNNNTYNLSTFNFTFPDHVNDIKSMMVYNMELPLTMYNISAARGNNYFKVSTQAYGSYIPATSNMVVIPDGQYTNQTLSAALNTAFNNLIVASTYKLVHSYTDVSNCSVLYAQPMHNSDITYFQVDFAVDSAGNFDKYNFKSKLGWLLGYRKPTYLVKMTSSTLVPSIGTVSESFMNLNGPSYVYLAIDEFSKGNQNSFMTSLPNYMINKNVLAKISLNRATYPFGSVITANIFNGYLMSDKRNYNGKIDLQKLAIQLLDENGTPINLNGLDFSFCLQLEYE